MTTGEHILNIKAHPAKERGYSEFTAPCSCGQKLYQAHRYSFATRQDARDAHRTHLDAAVASETDDPLAPGADCDERKNCKHGTCECGHAECGHEGSGLVQPDCIDCQCSEFKDAYASETEASDAK